MRCTVCGKDRFVMKPYRMDEGEAPAFECVHCGALNLDESAGKTERDRSSVKLAIAARAAVIPREDEE
jgi:hypothetical protein